MKINDNNGDVSRFEIYRINFDLSLYFGYCFFLFEKGKLAFRARSRIQTDPSQQHFGSSCACPPQACAPQHITLAQIIESKKRVRLMFNFFFFFSLYFSI